MKIIISESQEIDVKKKFIFMLLNNKNYNLVEIGDRIYFVKNIGDEKAEIRFDKSDGFCRNSYNLISFLSTITGFQESEVKELIGNWVEHTLQMEVKYNTTFQGLPFRFVEHTLQMEVKYNQVLRLTGFRLS